MTEKSLFWVTNDTGDGPAAGYTAADFYNFMRRLLIPGKETVQGVLRGVRNELVVSGSSSPVSVAPGAAIVYGLFYENSSALNLAVGIPVIGVTGGRVNLKADWSAQTVRAVIQLNSDGVAGIPALVQTAGAEWSIPLATFTINPAGQIALSDARQFCQFASYLSADLIDDLAGLSVIGRAASTQGAAAAITAGSDGQALRRSGGALGFGQISTAGIADGAVTGNKIANGAVGGDQIANGAISTAKIADDAVDDTKVGNRVPQFYRRQGGSATDWTTPGTDTYTPGAVRIQAGMITITINSGVNDGEATVTFPVSFSDKPLVFATPDGDPGYIISPRADAISKTQVTLRLARYGTSGTINIPVCWMAIGPE